MSVQGINSIANGFGPSGSSAAGQSATTGQAPSVKLPQHEVKKEISSDALQKAVDEANKVLSQTRPDIHFVIEQDSNNVVVMFVEPDTGEVVNRYPTEQSLAIRDAIVKTQAEALARREFFKNSNDGLSGLILKHKT